MLALGLLLALLNTVSGVNLGGECWSSANGVAAGGCAQGTQCGPWGGSWDNSSPWYCLAYPNLQAGATCDYANKVGPCDTGLSCISGKCTDPSSVPTSTSTGAPSTSTGAPSTSTGAPSTSSTPTCTETFEGGEICMDTNQPAATFENKCCKSPYTCDSITTRTSMCNGKDLPKDSPCWSDASGSTGTCNSTATPTLICKTPTGATRGVCSEFTDDPACVATGVVGYNICYNSDVQTDIKDQTCCADFNTGIKETGCRPDYTNAPRGDRYCMPTKLAAGDACGWTAASNYAGMCDRTTDKLECIDGKCTLPGATTTPGPVTTPPPCSGKGAKCYDADTADYVAGVTCCSGAACPVTSNPYDSAYCPDAAGAPTCTEENGDETGLTGTKCFDGAGSGGLIATVKCCYGPCSLLAADANDATKDGFCTYAAPADASGGSGADASVDSTA